MSAVAFTPPTTCTTIAKIAACFHPRSLRNARITSASIHGRPAHGSRITEMRAAKSSEYGVSMNSSAATGTPGPRTCSVRIRNSIPSAANRKMVPSQIRCDTHAGTPRVWRTQ